MNKSYENEVQELGAKAYEKLDVSVLKFFWQANPIIKRRGNSVPRFLRNVSVLKSFTDNELRLLSKFLHSRSFNPNEVIFNQNDVGIGLYFIYSGQVDIRVEKSKDVSELDYVLSLEKGDYFGELALLQERSLRSASVTARGPCELLGLLRPDFEELIDTYPIVASKLLQSVSIIVANRLISITNEVKRLKYRISVMERENGELRKEK